MKHNLTNDELLAALNKELEKQGLLPVEHENRRGAENDKAVLDAIDNVVKNTKAPAKRGALHAQLPWMNRQTLNSVTDRLARNGEIVGGSQIGYVRRMR